ncbi:hypothetical protein RchiOBHm_Chr7g0198491 [Rosa chinensis]|uniref:Uncharacterized protein n=1 Tax=Rosa chinensis TaxID=74649 RepID=A0A2P6P752_ROSCH|nr:hypothetical protein RchiOBHm_Chr7g0198491 [Rosa chinensis]
MQTGNEKRIILTTNHYPPLQHRATSIEMTSFLHLPATSFLPSSLRGASLTARPNPSSLCPTRLSVKCRHAQASVKSEDFNSGAIDVAADVRLERVSTNSQTLSRLESNYYSIRDDLGPTGLTRRFRSHSSARS